MIVLACHIPYFFFPTKEALLIIFDECKNRSMQKMISENIHQSNEVMGGE